MFKLHLHRASVCLEAFRAQWNLSKIYTFITDVKIVAHANGVTSDCNKAYDNTTKTLSNDCIASTNSQLSTTKIVKEARMHLGILHSILCILSACSS